MLRLADFDIKGMGVCVCMCVCVCGWVGVCVCVCGSEGGQGSLSESVNKGNIYEKILIQIVLKEVLKSYKNYICWKTDVKQ